MKAIKCNTPKGEYLIPLKPVVEERTNYYACEVDGYEKGSKEWNEEFEYGMNDDYEAIDWLLGNTYWEDWQDKATKYSDKVNVTDDDFWRCSDDFEIIDVPT